MWQLQALLCGCCSQLLSAAGPWQRDKGTVPEVPPRACPLPALPTPSAGPAPRRWLAGCSRRDQELLPALRRFPLTTRCWGSSGAGWGWATGPLRNTGTCRTAVHGNTEPSLTLHVSAWPERTSAPTHFAQTPAGFSRSLEAIPMISGISSECWSPRDGDRGESCCWCSCTAPALLHTLPRLWRGKAAAGTHGNETPGPAASLQPFPALPLAPGEPRAASLAPHTAPGSASPSRVPHRDNPLLFFRVALPNLSFFSLPHNP